MFTFILAVVTVILFFALLRAISSGEFTFAGVLFITMAMDGYVCYARFTAPDPAPTPEQVAAAVKRKAEIEEAKIPKVFSKTPDGCTVYKFIDNGYNHYFTRCEQQVTTNSTYSSGKSTKVEQVQTLPAIGK